MKTRIYFKALFVSALALVCLTTFDSCKKEDKESTLDEVIKVAPAETLKSELNNVTTLTNLPTEIKTAATTITTVLSATEVTTFSTVNVASIIQAYQANITLTSDEITKLKNNDEYTYNEVVARMTKLPSFTNSDKLSTYYTSMQSNVALKARLITNPGTVNDLYAVNLYQGVLDLQNYITTYTIPALQKLSTLQTDALKSASVVLDTKDLTLEEQQQLATLIILIFTNQNTINITFILNLIQHHVGGTIG